MKSERLLYAIGMIDENIVEEAAPKIAITRSVKKITWLKKLIPVAACTVITLFIVFVLPQVNKAPIFKNNTNPTPIPMNIVMNELKDFPQDEADIGLFWEDYIPLNMAELNVYYSVDIRPKYLPEILEKEMVVDVTYGNLGIFKRKDGTVYYDNNDLKYQSEDKARSVVITAAKGHLPKYDVLYLYEGKLQTSQINGNAVLISHYIDEEGEHYYAEFLYKDVGFNIWGNNITKDDFIKMIASYFENR